MVGNEHGGKQLVYFRTSPVCLDSEEGGCGVPEEVGAAAGEPGPCCARRQQQEESGQAERHLQTYDKQSQEQPQKRQNLLHRSIVAHESGATLRGEDSH